MNYIKIYNKLIERARIRQLEGYKERHHIIPKCVGGSNEENNLVYLTPKEHFLAHKLLVEIYPNNQKLWYALFLMAVGKQKVKEKQYVISSRVYEKLKTEHSKFLTGKKQSKETCLKKSNSMKGKKHSKETTQKIIESRRKKEWHSKETKAKISKALIGRKITWERNRDKKVYQLDMNNGIINEFKSANDADRTFGGKAQNVANCCGGRQATAYGFKWCYVKDFNK